MNGYAVVYEPAKQRMESVEGVGPVHAAPAEGDLGLPGPVTMCGISTDDLVKHQQDQPLDSFDTWYPSVGVHEFCSECDQAVAAAA
ncbi:hypothetical protein OG900_04515 [Streptomyces sp. NBC_00433]